MQHIPNSSAAPRAAMYLRCYPYDNWRMAYHQDALRRYADGLGLPEPTLYLDNGSPSRGPLPVLGELLRQVADGVYELILIPGPFVFSLDDRNARAIIRQITTAGCRVQELPSPQAPDNSIEQPECELPLGRGHRGFMRRGDLMRYRMSSLA